MIRLSCGQSFASREEIMQLLGGDKQKGITKSTKYNNIILLFMNTERLYFDFFYPKGTRDNCLFTGIGRYGNQDSLDDNPKMYDRNIAVMSHKADGRHLLLFEKDGDLYYFRGEYSLKETHQNIQPDDDNKMRRVFVFHITKAFEDDEDFFIVED